MTFKIFEPCLSVCNDQTDSTHYLKKAYPLEIDLHYNHNHAVHAADALRYRPVSQETKTLFTELFDEDLSPSSAYRKFIDNFEREREGEEVADRFFVPDYKWVYNFHAQYVKKRFGSMDGVDVYLKLVQNIKDYNERSG